MKIPKLFIAALILMFLTSYTSCWAHAIVIESNPREGAVLKQAPDRVQLRFNVKIEKALTRITLTKDNKQVVVLPKTDFNQGAPDRLEVPLPPLEPGNYIMRYSVLAADGHATQGVLRFSIEK
ncbi:MAG TPA: copper resistance CopC family protein [Burkholderiales bacterium]|nr:copper resistance CopC family protein [Burkholderiales bacterium]